MLANSIDSKIKFALSIAYSSVVSEPLLTHNPSQPRSEFIQSLFRTALITIGKYRQLEESSPDYCLNLLEGQLTRELNCRRVLQCCPASAKVWP